jgi:hypothetical protein
MNYQLGSASGMLAEVKRELDADRLAVAGAAQRLIAQVAGIPRVSPGEWSGPASMAYGLACDRVAHDCIVAVSELETSATLLLLALGELDAHV